jgi:hypothetical protein
MAAGYWDVDGTWREGDDTYVPPPTITPPPTTVSPPPTTVSPPPTTVSPPPTTVSPPPTTGSPPPTTTSPPPPGSTGAGYWDIDGTWREASDNFNPSASALSYVMPDGTVVRIGGGGFSPVALSVLSSIGRSPSVAENLSGSSGMSGTAGSSAFSVPVDQIPQGLGSSGGQGSEEPQSLTAPTVSPTQDTLDFLSSSFEMPKTFSTPSSTGILGVANYNRSRR